MDNQRVVRDNDLILKEMFCLVIVGFKSSYIMDRQGVNPRRSNAFYQKWRDGRTHNDPPPPPQTHFLRYLMKFSLLVIQEPNFWYIIQPELSFLSFNGFPTRLKMDLRSCTLFDNFLSVP